jgi:phosphoglucomutase
VWTGALRFDRKGNALDKVAVAINDPTSMRVDRIAQAFDAAVFRAEVGEANVVGLARRLRDQGHIVRILGEGAAGGNITHPSAVRDPIDTVFALLKLLTIRSDGESVGLFELWCDLSDQTAAYRSDFTLSDIIATLPSYVTTSAYESAAGLKINAADHGELKEKYREIFVREWEEKKDELRERYGFASWEAIAYNGLDERRGITRFSDAGRGGLKILFTDDQGRERAYLWMRGSGTEPIFRVMADVAGADRRIERELLEWQRRMITEADTKLVAEKNS